MTKPITRRTPLKRSAPPKRRTPVARANRARKLKAFAQAYGSGGRVLFVRSLPCIARILCLGEVENAHTGTHALGKKGHSTTIVPLCARHHEEMARNPRAFAQRFGLDLAVEAAATEQAWQECQEERP